MKSGSDLFHLFCSLLNVLYWLFLITVVGQSHASMFLSVMGLSYTDPIIGMCAWTFSLVWHYVCGEKYVCVKCSLSVFTGLSNILECRRISQPTFFLCLNCAEKVNRENFCDHMTSERHQHLSIVSARVFMFTLGCILSHRLHQYLCKESNAYLKSNNVCTRWRQFYFWFVELIKSC